jgi:hypothetical protein
MHVIRALSAMVVAVALAFAPVAAGAMDARMHASAAAAADVASPHASCDDHGATSVAAPDGGSDEVPASKGHCGACCLAHTGVSLPSAVPVIAAPLRWATLAEPEPGPPFVVPDRTYGLKRPPRA